MVTINSYREEELLLQIGNGEEHAFELLFNEWYPRIVFFIKRYAIAEVDAEEIASEAFIKFWNVRAKFPALAAIKSFLYVTSRNAALNCLRKSKNLPSIVTDSLGLESIAEEDPFYEQEYIRSDVIGALLREIDELPSRCREVVLLTYRDGLNSRQIAEKLNISISNVTSQRNRAIKQLRFALTTHFPLVIGLHPAILEYFFRNLYK